MELHLGLALSSSSSSASSCSSELDLNCNHESMTTIHHLKKRKQDDDGDLHVLQTLPLLVWNNLCNKNQLNQQLHDHTAAAAADDDDGEVQSNSVFVHHRDGGGVIGWPPVKSCRKRICHPKPSNYGGEGGGGGGGRGSKSMYVKVNMEGMGIARKVDLSLHHSYQTLLETLANMFGKSYEDVKLTYQDKEGDWLLAGDVPWGSFIETIQRLKLLKRQ